MTIQKGARPIKNLDILNYYSLHDYKECTVDHYSDIFYQWITESNNKKMYGLDEFRYKHFIQGTSQCFDNFVLRHAKKQIVNFVGDFQYHACISKFINHKVLFNVDELNNEQALIISFPFSDTGNEHVNFHSILQKCNELKIPVCLDIAYWGIAKDIEIDLSQWLCIKEVACSLSKPFYTLETHRIGIRFSREYADDGICMINEVGMVNTHSMSLGIHYMSKFRSEYMWQTYSNLYYTVCTKLNLMPTNTVIFGLGGSEYDEYNRGIPGNNRICISNSLQLKDVSPI